MDSDDLAVAKKTRRTILRPVSRDDLPTLFEWRTDVDNLHFWSSRRRIPTFEEFVLEFESDLQAGITLLVLRRRDNQPIGFVQAYDLNQNDGWAHILEYLVPE